MGTGKKTSVREDGKRAGGGRGAGLYEKAWGGEWVDAIEEQERRVGEVEPTTGHPRHFFLKRLP